MRLLIGYFGKDLLEPQGALYHLHHVACIGMTLASLVVPCAGPAVVAGACVLEAGSATMGMSYMYPESRGARLRWVVGMTASNAVAGGTFAYILTLDCLPLAVKATYTAVLGTLIFMRQLEVHKEPASAKQA